MIDKKILMPGDIIGAEEEYLPGNGAYCDKEGNLLASVAGVKEVKDRELGVFAKNNVNQISVGDVVYGVVKRIGSSMALVIIKIPRKTGLRYPDIDPFTGLHVSHLKRGYIESIRDAIHIGDILKAKVIKYIPKLELVDISTEGKELGVVLAYCSRCKTKMVKIGPDKVKCDKCGRVEHRKLSTDYGNIDKEVLEWK